MTDPDDEEDADLWFLPGPIEDEPDLPPGPRTGPNEGDMLKPWLEAQAALAVPLADLSWQLGALNAELGKGPAGWARRLALMEASELSWLGGERIAMDRILLWIALRLATDEGGTQALARASWAVRRLTEGPGPRGDLVSFLGLHAIDKKDAEERIEDQAATWQAMIDRAGGLHPVAQSALSFRSWALAGLDRGIGSQIEAAVTAARIGVPERSGTLLFLPLALGGAGQGLRAAGPAEVQLRRWIEGADAATRAALRLIETLRDWRARADEALLSSSGRTPPAMIAALEEWPILSAPMAERITGSSRASVHRALDWLVEERLAREVTGQERFRFWAAAVQ